MISVIEISLQRFPDLQPLYEAARSYLEIPQRIDLLNTRVGVNFFASSSVMKALIYSTGAARYAHAPQRDGNEQTQ